VVAFNDGFAVRLECVHSVPLNWFVPGGSSGGMMNQQGGGGNSEKSEKVGEGGSERETDVKKDIKGELDIIIVADSSHPVLPGQTTVVRFRMGIIDFS